MSFTIKSITHGMQDPRWTAQNKITQYKGLIRLYERDAKILQYDRRVAERKLKKQCYQIKKDIRKQNRALNNTISNNREYYKKTFLSEHRNLQLALQAHSPTKAIDYLEYNNFKKRKELDQLSYDVKKKSEELIQFKLQLSRMEDNLIYPAKPTPEEHNGQIISGKVKEARIRQEAALELYRTYKKILNVLKRDRIYFDTVLQQLQMDCHSQSQFLYRVTEIGQLATEYTDDRKQELKELESVVKRDMKSRINQIGVIEEQVQEIRFKLKTLIRRDSDINLPRRNAGPTEEDLHMEEALDNIRYVMGRIKESTLATGFEDIFSCIQNQKNLSKRLLKMYQKDVERKEELINKLNYARSIHSKMTLANADTNFFYQQDKEAFKEEIENVNIKCNEKDKLLQAQLEKVEVLRSNLMHLHTLCRIVRDNNKHVEAHKPDSKRDTIIIYVPPLVESETEKLLSDLESQLTNLVSSLDRFPQPSGTSTVTELDIEKFFQKFIGDISHHVQSDTEDFPETLVISTTPRDPKVITHEQIKKQSRLICEAHAPPEWMK